MRTKRMTALRNGGKMVVDPVGECFFVSYYFELLTMTGARLRNAYLRFFKAVTLPYKINCLEQVMAPIHNCFLDGNFIAQYLRLYWHGSFRDAYANLINYGHIFEWNNTIEKMIIRWS